MTKSKITYLMKCLLFTKWLILSIYAFLYGLHHAFADNIYQWTDPWGQIQYSKTQVQGSILSDKTELPKKQVSTEQQKQDAMIKKMKEIKNDNILYHQQKNTEKLLKQKKNIQRRHCQSLRNTLNDIKLKNSRTYYRDYYSGRYVYHRDYNLDFIEYDLNKQIRENCRQF